MHWWTVSLIWWFRRHCSSCFLLLSVSTSHELLECCFSMEMWSSLLSYSRCKSKKWDHHAISSAFGSITRYMTRKCTMGVRERAFAPIVTGAANQALVQSHMLGTRSAAVTTVWTTARSRTPVVRSRIHSVRLHDYPNQREWSSSSYSVCDSVPSFFILEASG